MNKKLVLGIVLMVSAACAVVFAQNAASDFEIDANGTITKYVGWGTTVVIPETINDVRVTAIGDSAFTKNDLTSVTIPQGVISIGGEAFASNKLTRVAIPDSVTSIGRSAFSGNQLTSVTIPGDGVVIGGQAFVNNPIASITLGRNHIFNVSYNASNERPDIVPGVNNRGSSLFYDYVCNDRKAGTYTANRANSDRKTEADFQYIETQYGAFITGYTGSSGNRLIIPSRLGGLAVKALGWLSRGVGRVQIPDSVTYIGDGAFRGSGLTSVIIGNSVAYIGTEAFYECKLTDVTIPDSVTHIGNSAFSNNQLTSVTIGNSVTHIGNSVFYNNKLTSVTIPDSVTSIGESAFSGNQLTDVIIPDSVTYIEYGAFGKNQLTSVTIGNSVTHIGNRVFSGNKLTSVTIPNSVTSIGENAFGADYHSHDNQLTSITIGENVTLSSRRDASSFRNGFDAFYTNNGRAAGTYTRPDPRTNNWTKQ